MRVLEWMKTRPKQMRALFLLVMFVLASLLSKAFDSSWDDPYDYSILIGYYLLGVFYLPFGFAALTFGLGTFATVLMIPLMVIYWPGFLICIWKYIRTAKNPYLALNLLFIFGPSFMISHVFEASMGI